MLPLPFLNPEAARAEIQKNLDSNPLAGWILDEMEAGSVTSDQLQLFVASRAPLGYSAKDLFDAIRIAGQAYNYLDEDRHQQMIDEHNKAAALYYAKYGTQGEF